MKSRYEKQENAINQAPTKQRDNIFTSIAMRLELFSPVLIKAGWSATPRTSLHCGFSGEAQMTLYSDCGRLVIESENWSLASRIAQQYIACVDKA